MVEQIMYRLTGMKKAKNVPKKKKERRRKCMIENSNELKWTEMAE